MKTFFLTLLSTCLLACPSCSTNDGIPVLSPASFVQALEADSAAVVLDVRTPEEYAEGHIHGAINLDWRNSAAFDKGVEQLDKRPTYYLYCRSGRRSHEAATHLRKQGFQVVDLKGGFMQWTADSFPVVR